MSRQPDAGLLPVEAIALQIAEADFMVKALAVEGGVQVGLVSFQASPTLDRGISDLAAADSGPFKTLINGLNAGGNTGIGTAFNAATFEFQRVLAAGRTRTAFLLSDLENNSGEDPTTAAQRLKDMGVRFFTVPVGAHTMMPLSDMNQASSASSCTG